MQQKEKHSISPAAISRIIIGIILLILLAQVGFFKTYIQYFPGFRDHPDVMRGGTMHFNWIMHLHGMMMMGWLFMLLVQPILILKGKIKWHHRVGRLSYVLAPLVVLFIYLANKDQYDNFLGRAGQAGAVARLSVSLPVMFFFPVLYGLAIYYRRRPALHMRYMCSTAFLFIQPALGRMLGTYFGIQPPFGAGSTIVLLLAGIVTIADSLRIKRISPFTLVFGFLLLHRIIWELRDTPSWQTAGAVTGKMF